MTQYSQSSGGGGGSAGGSTTQYQKDIAAGMDPFEAAHQASIRSSMNLHRQLVKETNKVKVSRRELQAQIRQHREKQ